MICWRVATSRQDSLSSILLIPQHYLALQQFVLGMSPAPVIYWTSMVYVGGLCQVCIEECIIRVEKSLGCKYQVQRGPCRDKIRCLEGSMHWERLQNSSY